MQLISVVVWLLFIATSIVSGVTLWVSEHKLRFYGIGVLVLLSPTFLGLSFYRQGEYDWLLGTSIVGIIIQIMVIRKLAEYDS